MNLAKLIKRRFGKERTALFEAELEHLVEKGYDKQEINVFLENYALPVGIFYTLSMFDRSKLSVTNLKKSLLFLFKKHEIILKTISKYLKPNSRILDFGCGRGLITCFLTLRNFEAYGVDISADALEIAKKLADKLECKPKFQLIKENELPFPAAYFDAILCIWTLHEIPQDQVSKLLSKMHRILRKTGSVFIVEQEEVALFETIKNVMNQCGFKQDFEKSLSLVYDHGKVSQALILKFVKK